MDGTKPIFILGIGYLLYVFAFRRSIVHLAGTVAGTAESPALQPNLTPGDQMQATSARPWKMAGWMVVALLAFILLIPCGIGLGLVVPWLAYRSAESEMGNLTIEYDNNKAPVQEIRIRGGNLPGERVFPVDSMPFRIRLAPGQYTLNGTKLFYEDSGQRLANMPTVEFTVSKDKETRLILGLEQSNVN